MRSSHQTLPSSGPEREALRKKGQFWTPQWVAEAMVAYVVAKGKDTVFDPAVGGGAFLLAARTLSHELGRAIAFSGAEIDPCALKEALDSGVSEGDLANVTIGDFLATPASTRLSGIVANPPYIRHHRLSPEKKAGLRAYGASIIGEPLDGRAGYHVYFLLKALQLLEAEGRLAFIMPADTCEGVSAPILWRWITSHYHLEAVITFAPDATPFPGVDTNPLDFFIRNSAPEKHLLWVRCNQPEGQDLKAWALRGPKAAKFPSLDIIRRELREALGSGLSRPPIEDAARGPELRQFARIMRGIASGANDFFLFTRERAVELGLPQEFLLPAIVRTRDVPGVELTRELLDRLDAEGRPTLLLSLDGRPLEQFPQHMREYLEKGEKEGISIGILVKTRQPWYRMETRKVPPFLFAYLGRRNARFVRNAAGVVPLTGFLCVYPRRQDAAFLSKLWQALSDPRTIANLVMVGKSYGDGCIKVEPRPLERLMIPKAVVAEVGLDEAPEPTQHRFSFAEQA